MVDFSAKASLERPPDTVAYDAVASFEVPPETVDESEVKKLLGDVPYKTGKESARLTVKK